MTEGTQQDEQQVAPVDPVFPRFFNNGEEQQPKLVGLIGYGLYEEARREWVDAFKRRQGRYPTPLELRTYETSWTASRLDGLKNAAVQILARYADTVSREVEAQAFQRALKGGFIRSVVRWIFSAVLFVTAVLALLVALSQAGLDPIGAYRALLERSNPTILSGSRSPIQEPERVAPIPMPYPPAEPTPSSTAPPPSDGPPLPPARRSGR